MKKLLLLAALALPITWVGFSYAQVNVTIGGGDWYQGHPGRWQQQEGHWVWVNSDDGNEYYPDNDQYKWKNPYRPYHNRNASKDRQNYQQYEQTHH
jgi:hypothetical protein